MRNTILTACSAFLFISNINVIAQNCSLTITGGNCTDSSLTAHVNNGSLATLTWFQYTDNVYGADTVSSQKSIAVVAGNHGGGAAANQFSNPPGGGIAVDGAGNIYVADVANCRIQKWAPGAVTGTTVAGGHGRGSAANQLSSPADVFVDDTGNVYVADLGNFRIQKWVPGATSGITVAGGHGSGSSANQLSGARSVYVAANGDIYIADTYNYRIQKWKPGAIKGTTVAGGNGPGTNANQLSFPIDVYLDAAKNIYIADAFIEDASYHRVQKWTPGATSGVTVAGGNGAGSGANQFGFLLSIYVDAAGNIYATDNGVSGSPVSRVQKWAAGAGSGVTVAGGHNSGWDVLSYPTGVAVKNGFLYVFDGVYNPRVQKYTLTNGIVDSTYHPVYAGTYHAQAIFKNGCTATSNSLIIRSIPETPVIHPANAGGRGNHCNGGNDSFFVSAWDDITSYLWKIPAQCSLVATRNDTIIIGFPVNFTSGRLTVKGKNICGISRPDTMVLLGRPITPTAIKGPRRVSPNQTGVNYSVTDLNSNHNWIVPPGAIIQSGQGTPSVTVTWGSVAGTLSVNSYNNCGASPAKEITVQLKNTLSANNEFVTGKNINETGVYVFPNPAINNVTIKFSSLKQANYTLVLQDITGALIMEKNIIAKQGLNTVTLDVAKYARGIYLVTIKNTEIKIAARFVKQ